MARGLVLCFHGGRPSIHLSSSISRVSIPISTSKCHQTLALSRPFRCHRLRFARFFCKCAPVGETIEVAKYKEVFERRMAMAGIRPDHHIALGVSGGPDSMALCVLAANWKTDGANGVGKSNGFINGLLAIVVDHGLRPESKDEAEVVSRRVSEMGIRCEISSCDWLNGSPKLGHMQEAAREMRYHMLQNVCFRNQISLLLVAHHADDQAELFILRLSRNSGVLGLAGMPFTSEIFSSEMHYPEKNFRNHGILLVRPLLDLWKEDMYEICQWGHQDWVEDPTNRSQIFARNRIRMSIGNLPSDTFKCELQAVISGCRKTRSFIDQVCSSLINQAVTIMDGYAVLDLQNLNPSKVPDVCLSKFIASILQFISQRQRPVRGSTSKLLLNYIRTIPCKTSLTAAGCYLCPAPRSKGTKVLVCCSVDCPVPSGTDVFLLQSNKDQNYQIPYDDLRKIIADGKCFSDQLVPTASEVPFLDIKSESVLTEARRLNILSESTCTDILLLQTQERNYFRSKTDETSEIESNHKDDTAPTSPSRPIWPGQAWYFMNRFLLAWKLRKQSKGNCECCVVSHEMMAEVRHMVESDWLYLSKLSKCTSKETSKLQNTLGGGAGQITAKTGSSYSDYLRLSAQRALLSLKSIPAAARRSLPVLVNDDGLLLSIPTIGFQHCACIEASAWFRPAVPLGGGHSSFI